MKPIELLGLVGTFLIFVSFFFNNIKWVRIMNMIGSAFFVVYGIIIGAWSVWILNMACMMLNTIKLIRKK